MFILLLSSGEVPSGPSRRQPSHRQPPGQQSRGVTSASASACACAVLIMLSCHPQHTRGPRSFGFCSVEGFDGKVLEFLTLAGGAALYQYNLGLNWLVVTEDLQEQP